MNRRDPNGPIRIGKRARTVVACLQTQDGTARDLMARLGPCWSRCDVWNQLRRLQDFGVVDQRPGGRARNGKSVAIWYVPADAPLDRLADLHRESVTPDLPDAMRVVETPPAPEPVVVGGVEFLRTWNGRGSLVGPRETKGSLYGGNA